MDKYEIIKRIENFASPELAEDWDCSGWAAETKHREVNKIMLCLTVTEDIIRQAKFQNCDMIISHHPLFSINCYSELVSESLQPSIDIYCAHTNLDRTEGGTTDTLIKTLGFEINETSGFLRYVDKHISTTELKNILSKISPNLRYVNNFGVESLQKIAFCAGSGSEFITEAYQNGADALVTGDVKFHTALDSPIVIFDIGHFESEILVLQVFEKLLPDVETIRADEKSPFIY